LKHAKHFEASRDLPLALEAVSKQRHFFSSAISEALLQDYIRRQATFHKMWPGFSR